MMNVYIYNADVYCSDCGEQIIKTLNPSQDTGDSDDYPQGPTDQGESDCPEHCGSCGVFLENSMTDEGYRYLREMLSDAPVNEDQAAVHATWIAFYGDPRSDYVTISPDPDYWGEGYEPAHYDAVMAALKRMGYEVQRVDHQGTTSETTVMTRGGYDLDQIDVYDEFDWFSRWCGMESGHDDSDAVYRALMAPITTKTGGNITWTK